MLAVLAATMALTGCGGTEKQGAVGDTLTSRTLAVTLLDARHDGPLYVVRIRICRQEPGQAINAFAFRLDDAEPDALASDLPVSRDGCERGVIAYRGADGPTALTFGYDDTGSARPGDREEHVDFTWTLD